MKLRYATDLGLGLGLLLAVSWALVPSTLQAQTTAQTALDRGSSLYREGRFAEAAEAFAEATALDPGSLEAWVSLGWAHRKAGNREHAKEVWERILKVDPARPRLWNEVAAIDIETESWSDAADALEKSLALQPDETHVRLRLAMTLESAGRLEEAERAYQELVQRDPESLTAILRLSSFYERQGKGPLAVRTLQLASERLPKIAHIFRLHLARLEARKADRAYARGDYQEAVESYQEAASGNPREPRYLENLGWAHRKSGELAEAIEIWERARLHEPRNPELARHLADAKREVGDLDQANQLYLDAWTLAPGKDAAIPYRLAEIALAQGRSGDAVEWVEKLFAFPGADEEWSDRIAGLFARAESPQPGLEVFHRRESVTMAPSKTRAALARLYAVEGGLAREAGDYPSAVQHYREALRSNPGNREALRDLGWTQWVLSDWDGCAETWKRLASLYPDDVVPLNLLTHLYLYRRSYPAAAATASRSLALRPDQPREGLALARALHWSEKYAEARSLAETLAREYPDELDIQRFWAELLMQYHDFERGLPQWQRVMSLGGTDARAEYYYVRSLYELGKYDTALAEAKRIASTSEPHPPHQNLLRLLADDALLRGDEEEGAAWLERLIEVAPESIAVRLELADLQVKMGALDDAGETLSEAERVEPMTERVEIEIAVANLLRREGKAEEAHARFVSIARAHPDNREGFWGLLQSASATGRYEEALRTLSQNRSTFLKPYEAELERARLLHAMGDGSEARRALRLAADEGGAPGVVPILLYHGLGNHPRTPSMPVSGFDSQMKALSEHGYAAVTVRELAKMEAGEMAFPSRPVAITFDDARIDSFELADPILAKYRMKATMFVPTGLAVDGNPFFADWDLLARYAATGRWDLQAHGHHAHDPVALDARGTEGSFLVNRIWLEDENRLETEEEYRRRVDEDYRRCKEEIETHVPGSEVVGYAFPFSEAGQENAGNVADASRVNESDLGRYFRFGFVQDENGYNELGREGSRFLKRYSVPRDFDGDDLLRQLDRQHPRARALGELARIQMWTGLYARSRETWTELLSERPLLGDDAAYYLASIDYQQGSYRSARRRLQNVQSAQGLRKDEVDKLERRLAWEEAFRIEPRLSWFEDSANRRTRSQALGFSSGALAPLEIEAAFGTVTFDEEGFSSFDALEAETGLELQACSWLRLNGKLRQRKARALGPDSLNFWSSIGFEGDHAELTLRTSVEDVDTLRARLGGIDVRGYQLQSLLKPSPRFWIQLDGRHGDYSDGNAREDVVGRLTLRPWSSRGWRVGVAGGWTDTRLQSDLYYTPEQLRFGRGLLSYGQSFASGWYLDTAVELGWARDELRGDRFTAYARGRAIQAWSSRFRSSLDWSYSNSPGYRSWSLGFGLHYGVFLPETSSSRSEPR